MAEIKVPIVKGDRVLDSGDHGDFIPLNMIGIERDIEGDLGYLYSHDGLEQVATGQGIDRGALFNERWMRSFRVSDQQLVEHKSDNSVVVIGDIAGLTRVRSAYSFLSIMFVADGVYRYDGASLVKMTDPDFGSPVDVCQIDQIYIFTDGEYLYQTDLNDETSINPLKFATSELSPDRTKAVGRTQDDLLIVFNRYTTEFFINQGNENFAFSRINQKAVSAGIVSTGSWCEMNSNIYILGGRKEQSCSFMLLGAGQTIALSTRYVDGIISSYSESKLDGAWLESRMHLRDELVYLRLPNHTLIYNARISEKFGPQNAWSEMQSDGTNWRACNGIYDLNLGSWIYGDLLDSRIGKLTPSKASQYGQIIDSQWGTPMVPVEGQSIDELEIKTVSGFGASDTAIYVSTTQNAIFHSMEWSRFISVALDYNLRYIVRRLGYVRDSIGFKFRARHTEKINVSGLVIRTDG